MTRTQRPDGNSATDPQRATAAIRTIAVGPGYLRQADEDLRNGIQPRIFEAVAWDEV